ncbi:hypothetical protein SAMN05192553_104449 [Cyclobacterium xiamenense]|uniref:Uncharacterized protein n=1 Tax=Cyclobacterium xiamenense TaxID=1297121 RepID=A0A1H6ZFN5_9BACT|nr:hypothetical protein SAMN05192553_104449 [Cyclobacterium xiamenense]
MQQALEYAEILQLLFVFSSNGDLFTNLNVLCVHFHKFIFR